MWELPSMRIVCGEKYPKWELYGWELVGLELFLWEFPGLKMPGRNCSGLKLTGLGVIRLVVCWVTSASVFFLLITIFI